MKKVEYSSLTVADIYAIKKYFEDSFNRLKWRKYIGEINKKLKPKVDIKWELDEKEPEALTMFYKMNPTLYTLGRKPRIY